MQPPCFEPLEILFEDAHLLAVVKPAGVLMQGIPSGEPTLEDAVRARLDPNAPASVYLGTVHRLDRPVSGVAVWAKTPKAARRLSARFQARDTVKEYWAVVERTVAALDLEREGVWDDWLCRSTDHSGVVRPAATDTAGARRAVTRFRVGTAVTPEGTAWLELWPETGRTHQLRAQAALRDLPVWGDLAYGSTRPFSPGIALHARALTFEHPMLRQSMTITAELPVSWALQGIALSVRGERIL